jgi:hypothetical protein
MKFLVVLKEYEKEEFKTLKEALTGVHVVYFPDEPETPIKVNFETHPSLRDAFICSTSLSEVGINQAIGIICRQLNKGFGCTIQKMLTL